MTEQAVRTTPAHSPTINGTGSYGSWAACSCGWHSGQLYRGITAAHVAHGKHLEQARA